VDPVQRLVREEEVRDEAEMGDLEAEGAIDPDFLST